MINYTIGRVKNIQILDKDTSKPVADLDGVGNVTTEIETSSLGDEKLSFSHSASFEGTIDCNLPTCPWVVDNYNRHLYGECYIPILIQARWHKKFRTNKKWLKRYGMKEDKILVRYDIDAVSSDPYGPEVSFEFSSVRYKFRQDQLRKNLKIEMHYE